MTDQTRRLSAEMRENGKYDIADMSREELARLAGNALYDLDVADLKLAKLLENQRRLRRCVKGWISWVVLNGLNLTVEDMVQRSEQLLQESSDGP